MGQDYDALAPQGGGGGGDATGTQTQLVPAMFIFGDSLIDNGNNNDLPSFAKANYFPYGIDFNGGPTGRFSNGYTMVDTIGTFFSSCFMHVINYVYTIKYAAFFFLDYTRIQLLLLFSKS